MARSTSICLAIYFLRVRSEVCIRITHQPPQRWKTQPPQTV